MKIHFFYIILNIIYIIIQFILSKRIIPNLGTLLPNVPSAGGDYIIGEEQ